MLDNDIQSELLRDTVDPERALNIAVNMEMGHQNQQRISSNNNNNASGSAINAIQSFNRFRGANARKTLNTEQNVNSENQNVNYMNYNEQLNSEYESVDNNFVANVENLNTPPIALQNKTITIGNTDCHLLLNSGSGCTIINMSLAKEIMFNCMQRQWSDKKPIELKSFSNDIVKTLGTLKTPVRCSNWKNQKAKIMVVADGFRPIPGRDLFDQLGITISQKPCPNIEVNIVETPCAMKQSLAKELPELISRIGKSKHHNGNSKFHRNYRISHQKGRKVPIHLQPKVMIELKKLLNKGHIEKLTNCSDQFFISPIVTVKKDKSIKIALVPKI